MSINRASVGTAAFTLDEFSRACDHNDALLDRFRELVREVLQRETVHGYPAEIGRIRIEIPVLLGGISNLIPIRFSGHS